MSTSINFPTAPSSGSTYSYGNAVWTWDGTKWLLFSRADAFGNPLVNSITVSGSLTVTGSVSIPGLYPPGNWTPLTGSYASATTFTYSGTDREANLAPMSLFTCTDSGGSTRRVGYIKGASNTLGTITATVVANTDLASGDKDFKVAYDRKANDYLHLVSIPGEVIQDSSYSQGVWAQDIQVNSYLLPVDTSVLTAASGSGAILTYNIYRNTSSLFTTPPDMVTNTVLRSQRPTTSSLSAADSLSLRIISSSGSVNRASNFQAKLYIVPQVIYTAF